MNKQLFGLFLGAALCVTAQAQSAQTPVPQQPAQNPAAQAPAGQQPAAPDQSEDVGPTLKIGVNEVNLIFTVTDQKSHYISNLKQSDFALLDDQKAPEKALR